MNGHDGFREMLARRPELSGDEELDLRQHLRECPECQRRADAYARQRAMLRAVPLADPAPALRMDVLRRVHEPPRRRRLLPGWPVAAGIPAAGLAAAAAVVLALALHSHGGSRVTPQAIQPVPTMVRNTAVPTRQHRAGQPHPASKPRATASARHRHATPRPVQGRLSGSRAATPATAVPPDAPVLSEAAPRAIQPTATPLAGSAPAEPVATPGGTYPHPGSVAASVPRPTSPPIPTIPGLQPGQSGGPPATPVPATPVPAAPPSVSASPPPTSVPVPIIAAQPLPSPVPRPTP